MNRVDVPVELQWLCPECGDMGVIFRGTVWDIGLGAPPRSADEPVVVVRLSPAEYWTVRQICVLDVESERIVFAARHEAGLIVLSGSEEEFGDLAGFIADEAMDERNARRCADLNAAFDRIHAELGPFP